jgi:YesN/AraC family two-component response regulator
MNEMLKNLTVLFVEDEESVRNNIAQALRRRIGTVVTAGNGEEGLEQLQLCDPDIVITDIEMPVMNGIDMIKKIRMIYNHHRPIIVITAYKDEEHYTKLADAYLFKPVLIDELETLIVELVKQYRLEGSSRAN